MKPYLDDEKVIKELIKKIPIRFGKVLRSTPFESHASQKKYIAIETAQGTIVGSYLNSVIENNQFVVVAEHLRNSGVRTPEIYYHDESFIIQEYLGNYNMVEWFDRESVHLSNRKSSKLLCNLIKNATSLAADIHARTTTQGLYLESFVDGTALRDIELFIKHWGDESVEGELLEILNQLKLIPNDWIRFCHRDYQLRNIMMHDGNCDELVVIDFQSALRGPITYDLASLIFSSRYSFTEKEIGEFLEHYAAYSMKNYGQSYDLELLEKYLYLTAILRIIQAIAAYKRSTAITGKNFCSQIVRGLKNLGRVIDKLEKSYGYLLPQLKLLVREKTDKPTLKKLPVVVRSFSYKQEGLPILNKRHVNIMLDLRTFSNPGRIPAYRILTGKDSQTKTYLEQFPEIVHMRESLLGIVRAYYQGDYEFSASIDQVSIYLGCNGGRHRSVYFAEIVYQEIRRILDGSEIKITIKHPNI